MQSDKFGPDDLGRVFFTSACYRARLEGFVTTKHGDEYLISYMHESDDGGEYAGEYGKTSSLFRKAPMAAQAEELKKLNQQIAEARQTYANTLKAIREAQTDSAEIIARLKQHKQLELIEEFLDGSVLDRPCVVEGWGGPKAFKSFKEALADSDYLSDNRDAKQGLKLLTLFGKTNGDLQWGINTYYDGSGSTNHVTVVKTDDDAETFMKNWYVNRIKSLVADNSALRAYELWDKQGRPTVDAPTYRAIIDAKHNSLLKQRVAKTAEREKIVAELNTLLGELQDVSTERYRADGE